MEIENRIDQTGLHAPQQQRSVAGFVVSERTVPFFDPLIYILAVGLASFLDLRMMAP
jgi:hypothetical protein